jgi:Uma2 family endonuclease
VLFYSSTGCHGNMSGMNTTLDAPKLLGIPAHRIHLEPAPGTATEDDVIHLLHHQNRICELIDGTLVEKPMGTRESFLAATIIRILGAYVYDKNLGLVSAPDGPFRMLQGNIRYPDVSFVPWSALPDGELPEEAIWSVVPTLAVEVLSESNTHAEMVQKWGELSELGTKVLWLIDPATSTAEIWRPGEEPVLIGLADKLDAAPALPGFLLPLADIFDSLKLRRAPKA